jgi:phosphoglycerol transferase MdoB-like AlkP superfamily enzyme
VVIATKFAFYFYHSGYFSEFSFSSVVYAVFYGYKFDFATSSVIALLANFFDVKRKLFAFLASVLIVAVFMLQIGDILYFSESSRHIGYEITDIFADFYSLLMTGVSQHFGMFSVGVISSIILFVGLYKFFSKCKAESFSKSYLAKKLFLIALSVFFIRGMFQHIPLNPWQSNQIGDTKLAILALNDTYNVVFSLANKSKKLKPQKLPSILDEEIKNSFKSLYSDENLIYNKPFKQKPNVVFFFMESWSAKFLKPYGAKIDVTPNFTKFYNASLRPKVAIAGGHRTTEVMFATLASFQNPLGKSVAKTQLQDNHYNTIIKELNKKGYTSAFFQGTAKETSGTGSLANSLGFKYSYGKRDIKNRIYEMNYWGVHDFDLYNFIWQKFDDKTIKEPFVLGINGATTHDTKLPKGIKKKHFVEDEKINDLLNVFNFSDKALGEFITKMEQKYPNTIFVIFADHCGGYIADSLENYEIPLVFYSKKLIKPKFLDKVVSQMDIAPSVSDMILGSYKKIFSSFSGKSLLGDEVFFAPYYHNGILGFVKDKKIVELNIQTNKYKCYKFSKFKKEATSCDESFKKLRDEVLSFTTVSQKLLFEDKMDEFKIYRDIK